MLLSYEASALAVILVAVVSLWVSERLPLPVTALLGAVAKLATCEASASTLAATLASTSETSTSKAAAFASAKATA